VGIRCTRVLVQILADRHLATFTPVAVELFGLYKLYAPPLLLALWSVLILLSLFLGVDIVAIRGWRLFLLGH
jgi:hypothetical protein